MKYPIDPITSFQRNIQVVAPLSLVSLGDLRILTLIKSAQPLAVVFNARDSGNVWMPSMDLCVFSNQ